MKLLLIAVLLVPIIANGAIVNDNFQHELCTKIEKDKESHAKFIHELEVGLNKAQVKIDKASQAILLEWASASFDGYFFRLIYKDKLTSRIMDLKIDSKKGKYKVFEYAGKVNFEQFVEKDFKENDSISSEILSCYQVTIIDQSKTQKFKYLNTADGLRRMYGLDGAKNKVGNYQKELELLIKDD